MKRFRKTYGLGSSTNEQGGSFSLFAKCTTVINAIQRNNLCKEEAIV